MKKMISLVLLWPLLAGAQIYVITDEHGNKVYSDIPPSPDAPELELKALNISDAPKTAAKPKTPETNAKPSTGDDVASRYSTLSIESPTQNAFIRDNEGTVKIAVNLSPPLHTQLGDNLIIELNGQEVSNGTSASITLDNVDRGTHSVSARVVDKDAKHVISSETVEFHLARFFKKAN